MLSKNLKSFILGLALVLTLGKVAQAQTPSPNPYANLYWEASLNLAQAKQDVQQFENQNIRNTDQVVVAVFDTKVDCSTFKAYCLPLVDCSANRTADPCSENDQYNDNSEHGTSVASIIGLPAVNGVGMNLGSRIKILPVDVTATYGDDMDGDAMRRGLQYVMARKAQGLNIVAINISFAGGDDIAKTRPLLLKMADPKVGVVILTGAGNSGFNLDTVYFDTYPVDYAADPSLRVISGAMMGNNEVIFPGSNYGPRHVTMVGVAENVPAMSPFRDHPSIFGGTSAVAPQLAAAYALIRLYAEADPDKAFDRLKASAVMIPGAAGKVGYGKLDLHKALTMTFNPPTNGPVLVSATNSPRAIAFDSVTFLKTPFIAGNNNFSPDKRTRFTLFAQNINPNSPTTVQIKDLAGNIYYPSIENIDKVPNLDSFTQITVKVPDGLQSGDTWVSITNGTTSNAAILSFQQ
jgi:hypothetical protein